jgi:hypothetical protein
MPNDDTMSLQKFMNSLSHVYVAIIDYIKFVPEFTNLSNNTKVSLLKNNLNQIFRLNSALIIHTTGIVDDVNAVVFKNTFPSDLYLEVRRCAMDLLPFVYDPIFLKLFFVVLIFSTSLNIRYDVNQQIIHTQNILSVQNFYLELLWRYILYRCSTYRQSVQLFTSFIMRLLHSQMITEKIREHITEISPNKADQLEPIMRTMWLDKEEK